MLTMVSCIMPTSDRRDFIPAAIDCWLKQDYERKELIIVDDYKEKARDLIPANPDIHYFVFLGLTLGEKRNYCNDLADGGIICHFDDDDFSAPDRISDQVTRLEQSGKAMTGYSALLFWDILKNQAKKYVAYKPGYVCGTSFCYLKSLWVRHPFEDRQVGSDNAFIKLIPEDIAVSNDDSHLVARIHANHTSKKNGITQIVARDAIPEGFWRNEELRLNGGNAHAHPY